MSAADAVRIREARFPDEIESVRALFREYAQGLSVDLAFQDFEAELASLPGKYAPPAGRVLLAERGGDLLGCVAMRPLEGEAAEMKRLFVRPSGRGMQLGRALVERLCEVAASVGYRCMRLDTLPEMQAARGLYAALGFVPTTPYVFNPVEGTAFMECALPLASFPAGSRPEVGARHR